MAFSLFPKEIKFFELFSEQNRKIMEAMEILKEIFSGAADVPLKCAEIDEIEKEGNFIYRAICRKLSLNFITPIDRGDIHELNLAQEELLNAVRAISSRISRYEPTVFTESAWHLVCELRDLGDETGKMLNCMRMKSEADEEIRAAGRLKDESDQLLQSAVKELWQQKNPDHEEILVCMVWTQIYDRIEEAFARLERLVHVIEGIMLKYV